MTDTPELAEQEPEQPAPLPIATDSFTAVAGVIAPVTSPKRCGELLHSLQARQAAALAAEAKLAKARKAHDEAIAKDRAEPRGRARGDRGRQGEASC
jgi:hypothetical protein